MDRKWMIALFGALALMGCRNMGLEYAGAAEEAQVQPTSALVAAVHRTSDMAEEEIIVDGRLWLPAGAPVALDDDDVRPVGSAGGHTMYGRSWDQSPYDMLFTRGSGDMGSDEWRGYRPVIGGGSTPGSQVH